MLAEVRHLRDCQLLLLSEAKQGHSLVGSHIQRVGISAINLCLGLLSTAMKDQVQATGQAVFTSIHTFKKNE